MLKRLLSCLLVSFLPFLLCKAQQSPLVLWYDRPASMWEETLPLGNGRLGMTPDGGVFKEKITLNDITLWSGSPQDANNYEANKYLPQIRQLLFEGKNDEAQDLINKHFVCRGPGSGGAQYGKFQVLGELQVEHLFNGKPDSSAVSKYKRDLDLSKAMATAAFILNGVTYKREYFTSFNNDVGILRMTASTPGQLNCRITMSRPERWATKTEKQDLVLYGRLDNGIDGNGMQYQANVRTRLTGGKLRVEKDALVISGATEIILYVTAATDFKNNNYKVTIERELNAALRTPYATEQQLHISRFGKLFNRMQFSLGEGRSAALATDKRLSNFYQHPQDDPGLAALFFQFGRYLSISSTRPGLLPPNLQGLWAPQINTPWNGDYHLDINIQMNQWPVEVGNLSELNLPLVNLVRGLVAPGQKTAKAYYNAEGWIAHVITNVWGFTEPGEDAHWGVINAGSGWLCNNLWEHYAFTDDKKYLKDIYPILKGSAAFYNSVLVKDPATGWLVTSPSVSPENWFQLPNGKRAAVCMGPTIDNQIVRELFTHVIEAASALGIDAAFSKTLQEKIPQLPPVAQVGREGRLMEWLIDYKEAEPQHRHVSHLYGLFPASQITPQATPALAEASRKTLEARGDDGPSWSIAYKILWWARLQDGNRSFKLLRELLKPTYRTDINYGAGGGVYRNMLSAGPPFQIDGNFGATAGIAEMLIQSHDGYIELLPAIPDAWKATGKVKGLKARGNFTVDFEWKDGVVTHYRITSPSGRAVQIKVNGVVKTLSNTRI